MGKIEPPVNDTLLDEHLFPISTNDLWYRHVLTYLCTHNFSPHLTYEDRWNIFHQSPCYILIGGVLYQQGVDTILHHYLTHDEVEEVLNDFHVGACGGHIFRMPMTQKIIRPNYFGLSSFVNA